MQVTTRQPRVGDTVKTKLKYSPNRIDKIESVHVRDNGFTVYQLADGGILNANEFKVIRHAKDARRDPLRKLGMID